MIKQFLVKILFYVFFPIIQLVVNELDKSDIEFQKDSGYKP